MATLIRAELSKKNKYWIDKHRHYELKHFCLQYPSWKKAYADILDSCISLSRLDDIPGGNNKSDLTAKYALMKVHYADRIRMIEKVAMETDELLWRYILKAVTEELSFTYLKTKMDIPCGKDMYYDRYRRFFWLLDRSRN